ncbi:MAG: IclR family transcriptional regulator [Victivallaceae bacterium]
MMEKRYNAPAAASTLEVLEFMAGNPGAWGPTELAKRLDSSANLTFRVLSVLQEKGYVKRNPAGQYELTAGLYSLGMKLHNSFDLRKQARPFLEELAESVGESCQIQIPAGGRMLQLDFVPPPADYYLAVTPGIRLYWHGNAFGKAVWAFLPSDESEALLQAPLPRLTPHTVVDPAQLRTELTAVRETFSASEFDEYVLGSYCIGSPVFDATGRPVAGIGVTGLSSRLKTEAIPGLRQLVRTCADMISAAIGGR